MRVFGCNDITTPVTTPPKLFLHQDFSICSFLILLTYLALFQSDFKEGIRGNFEIFLPYEETNSPSRLQESLLSFCQKHFARPICLDPNRSTLHLTSRRAYRKLLLRYILISLIVHPSLTMDVTGKLLIFATAVLLFPLYILTIYGRYCGIIISSRAQLKGLPQLCNKVECMQV